MTSQLFVNILLSALSLGVIYFLLSSGFALVFSLLRVSNFSHGSLIMWGAYLGVYLVEAFSNFTLGLVVSVVIVGFFLALVEYFLFRRLYGGNPLFELLLTFGLIFILDEAVKLVWGAALIPVNKPDFLKGTVMIYGEPFAVLRLYILSLGVVVCAGLYLLLKKTKLGLIITAGIENKEMVRALGININKVFTFVCWLGGFLAGLGGFALAYFTGLSPEMGASQLLNVLVIVVVGGLGSFMGAAIAAVIMGLAEAFIGFYLPEMAILSSFIVMFIVLGIKPSGLLGEV
ncbi:MAG: High-affinity branched-chain amino acid transport system permease protein LivH [Smithella sp. PtaU1.Bin162]|nr:MAG: High-affinity branched-chain amino acid transport system permease protein LivH [Smithella sp. PtaU1.Bin162]